jgi:hypothetical protein
MEGTSTLKTRPTATWDMQNCSHATLSDAVKHLCYIVQEKLQYVQVTEIHHSSVGFTFMTFTYHQRRVALACDNKLKLLSYTKG